MLNICIENFDYVNNKWSVAPFCAKSIGLDGWMGGWMEAKAGLRIAYSNQKLRIV